MKHFKNIFSIDTPDDNEPAYLGYSFSDEKRHNGLRTPFFTKEIAEAIIHHANDQMTPRFTIDFNKLIITDTEYPDCDYDMEKRIVTEKGGNIEVYSVMGDGVWTWYEINLPSCWLDRYFRQSVLLTMDIQPIKYLLFQEAKTTTLTITLPNEIIKTFRSKPFVNNFFKPWFKELAQTIPCVIETNVTAQETDNKLVFTMITTD